MMEPGLGLCRFAASCRSLIESVSTSASGAFIPVTSFAPAVAVFSSSVTPATAIGIGDDTDTVAAIAGALLGARRGTSAIPAQWRRISQGILA